MDSIRQNKVSRLIQRELSNLFQHELAHLTKGTMVTVTVVRVTPDLSLAKVYLSLFPPNNREESMKTIKLHSKEIRSKVGNNLRNNLRKIPDFVFYLDDSLDYAERIDDLLKK